MPGAGFGQPTDSCRRYFSLVTSEVYLDGELIGSVTGALKTNSTVREWIPDHLGAGIKQHGPARFRAIDALVCTT